MNIMYGNRRWNRTLPYVTMVIHTEMASLTKNVAKVDTQLVEPRVDGCATQCDFEADILVIGVAPLGAGGISRMCWKNCSLTCDVSCRRAQDGAHPHHTSQLIVAANIHPFPVRAKVRQDTSHGIPRLQTYQRPCEGGVPRRWCEIVRGRVYHLQVHTYVGGRIRVKWKCKSMRVGRASSPG